ncbi:MAG TPA: hypothetical protein DCS42_04125 [Nitrospiraceae bacterium]|nr:hypothetical protein [Nitrospiraceae bacterium]
MHFTIKRSAAGLTVVITMLFFAGGVSADSTVNDRRNVDSTIMDAYGFGYHTGICNPAETGMPEHDRMYAALERHRAACERGVSDRNRGETFDSDMAVKQANEATR